jgi:hypothetical protein
MQVLELTALRGFSLAQLQGVRRCHPHDGGLKFLNPAPRRRKLVSRGGVLDVAKARGFDFCA